MHVLPGLRVLEGILIPAPTSRASRPPSVLASCAERRGLVSELPSSMSTADPEAPPSPGERLAALLLERSPLGAVVGWVAGIRASVHAKLLGAFLLVIVLFFAMGGLWANTIVRMSRHDELLHEAHRRVDWSRQIQHALAMQLNSTSAALMLRDEIAIASVLRENNRFNSRCWSARR